MKLQLLLILIFIYKLGFSQDLVITNDGDSLNCKIIKSKFDKIFFSYVNKNEIRDTLLSKNLIRFSQFNFYKLSLDSLYKLGYKRVYPRFRLFANVGWSHQTFKIFENEQPIYKEYLKDLKSGYNFGADISYFFSKPIGIGLKYNNFKSHSELHSFYITQQDGSVTKNYLKTDLIINYIGPTFCTRILSSNHKNAITFDLSVGYINYKENDEIVNYNKTKITGQNIGLLLNTSIDISVSKHISFCFLISYMIGSIHQFDSNNGYNVEKVKLQPDEYINVSRIDFTIGLKYNR